MSRSSQILVLLDLYVMTRVARDARGVTHSVGLTLMPLLKFFKVMAFDIVNVEREAEGERRMGSTPQIAWYYVYNYSLFEV